MAHGCGTEIPQQKTLSLSMAWKPGLNLFQTSRQIGRIPLVLVLGECVEATRAFLKLLLVHQAFDDSVVISTKKPHVAPLAHTHLIELERMEANAQDSCLCCGLHGALGDTLRTLFFGALNDRTKRLDRILIESDSISSHQLAHTLKHTPFLGQRYVHQLTFRVVDAAQFFLAGVDSHKGLDPVQHRSHQFLVLVDQGMSLPPASMPVPLSCLERKDWSNLIKEKLPYQKVLFVSAQALTESGGGEGALLALAQLSEDFDEKIETK
ncbi:hypothetical protein [Zwartia sp.]|uniref:hypothetical protein n=1 Tax=Zwartia sp. TaxID=2978004 RepID=UPI003BAE48DA